MRRQSIKQSGSCEVCGKPVTFYPSKPKKFCSHACYWKAKVQSIEERFWRYVRKTDSCWIWTGTTNKYGHGHVVVKNTTLKAPRISWMIHVGPIPVGIHVLHNCPGGDNPRCVNPAHLFLGTHQDNMADKKRKGRCSRTCGEKAGAAKLTDQAIAEIRSEYAAGGVSYAKIARKRGVSRSLIGMIVLRKRWRHLP